ALLSRRSYIGGACASPTGTCPVSPRTITHGEPGPEHRPPGDRFAARVLAWARAPRRAADAVPRPARRRGDRLPARVRHGVLDAPDTHEHVHRPPAPRSIRRTSRRWRTRGRPPP